MKVAICSFRIREERLNILLEPLIELLHGWICARVDALVVIVAVELVAAAAAATIAATAPSSAGDGQQDAEDPQNLDSSTGYARHV